MSESDATTTKGEEPVSYADALRDRLKRIQAELEGQGSSAVALRHSVDAARAEAETNARELAKLRAKWAAEQPRREALLKETGEAERILADRERRCAELLAAHAAAELERGPRVVGAQEDIGSNIGASGDGGSPNKETAGSSSAAHPNSGRPLTSARQLGEHRQRLAILEKSRTHLTQSLQELRDAARQEAAGAGQLQQRCEALRRESQSLKAAAEAARESEARMRRKLEAMDGTVLAAQQRQQGMERTIAELRTEVQTLRSELSASTATSPTGAGGAAAEGATTQGGSATTPGGPAQARGPSPQSAPVASVDEEDEAATWATNRLLQAKVLALQEELERRRYHVQELRLRAGASAAKATVTAVVAAQ